MDRNLLCDYCFWGAWLLMNGHVFCRMLVLKSYFVDVGFDRFKPFAAENAFSTLFFHPGDVAFGQPQQNSPKVNHD